MQIAVLGSPDSWYLNDLRRAAADRHQIVQCAFKRMTSHVGPQGLEVAAEGIALHAMDAILIRSMSPGSLEQVVFRMDALGRLHAAGKLVVNPPRAVECAVDKYLTTIRLAEAGLLTPRTAVCQTPDDAMEAFERLGGDIVMKPVFGSEGRGITRLTDPDLALRAFKLLSELGAVLYLQEFIPHTGHDIRVLLVGSRMFGMRRCNALDWRTNVSRGASAEPVEIDEHLAEQARRAAHAVGATVAGVDLLPGVDGRLYAIEVNAVPGWRALSKALHVDVAAILLEYLQGCRAGVEPSPV